MNRDFQLLIKPSLLGLVIAAAIGFGLSVLWGTQVINPEGLNPDIYDRAMQDRVYHDRVMAEVRQETTTVLLTVAVFAWMASATWFILCWKRPVAEVGNPRRMRSHWLIACLVGLMIGFVAASLLVFFGYSLASVMTMSPLISTLLFVGPYFAFICYATSVLCTHPVYLPAIPFSRWRPW